MRQNWSGQSGDCIFIYQSDRCCLVCDDEIGIALGRFSKTFMAGANGFKILMNNRIGCAAAFGLVA